MSVDLDHCSRALADTEPLSEGSMQLGLFIAECGLTQVAVFGKLDFYA